MEVLQQCPFCCQDIGSETLEGLGFDHEVLEEMRRLREEGKLTQAVFLAVKIVRTVQDNPQWVKELLDEQTRILSLGFKDSVDDGKSEILRAVHELMGSPLRGKIQEISIAKRLKAVVPTDSFSTENSTRKGEDVECTVLETNDVAGTIVVESKKVKTWSQGYVEQTKQYMTKKGTEFGIVATTAMPSDALSDSVMIDNVLVVKADYVEIAYLFMREYLVAKAQLEGDYQSKLSQLKVGEQVLQELRNVVNSGGLDEIITTVTEDTDHVDTLVNRAVDYVQNFANQVKKKTGHIRAQVTKLMSDHIQVIRAKLEPKATA
jgi:hypothetical protein